MDATPGIDDGPHRTAEELKRGLDHVLKAPKDQGVVKLVVRRPRTDIREVLDEADLSVEKGLEGDRWFEGSSGSEKDLHMQLNLMSYRVASLVAVNEARIPFAGDQFYLDLDLSEENLPVGAKLHMGTAIVEITPEPHTGCMKFARRFGKASLPFVNSSEARKLRLRGVCARVVQAGTVRTGDLVTVERDSSTGSGTA